MTKSDSCAGAEDWICCAPMTVVGVGALYPSRTTRDPVTTMSASAFGAAEPLSGDMGDDAACAGAWAEATPGVIRQSASAVPEMECFNFDAGSAGIVLSQISGKAASMRAPFSAVVMLLHRTTETH